MSIDIKNFLKYLESKNPIYNTLLKHSLSLPQDTICELFYLSSKLNITPSAKYHSLHLLNSISLSEAATNLIIPCILISTKMHQNDPITFSQLKFCTTQSRSSICKLETEILSNIKQELTQNTLFDWVSAFIELCFFSLSEDLRSNIRSESCRFIDFLYIQGDIIGILPVGVLAASILACTIWAISMNAENLSILNSLALSLHVDIQVIEKLSGKILELFAEYEDFENRMYD